MPSYTIMTPKGGLEKLGGLLTAGGIALWIAHKVLSPCPSKRKSTLNAPPQAAFALPIFGHLFYLLLDSSRFLDWCASHYGEVFDLKVLWKTITVVNSQSAVEAMKADSSQLSMEQGTMKGKRSLLLSGREVSHNGIDLFHMHYVMSSAIFDLSFRVTPILARKRLSRSAMDVYAASISENARVFFDALPCTSSVPRSDHFFQRLITVIGMPSLVGEELASDPLVADSFATVNMDTVSRTCVFLLIPSGLHLLFRKYYLQPALLWHQRVAQERILPIVRELRNAPGRQQHLLQDLVDYRKKDGTAFTVEEITEGVKMIAFAATFGSHNILTAAVCLLVARPDLQAKLRNELDRVLSLSGRPKEDALSLEAINQMTFLNRFVREVIRQNADKLGTFRAVMQDVFTFSNGYQIPKGKRKNPPRMYKKSS